MDNAPTIFVSMASYRDPELIPTLRDMLCHAARPEYLHIAICWQDNEDLSLFSQAGLTPEGTRTVNNRVIYSYSYRQARIDVISVHYYTSRGACWARHLAETLYENERFFLQIDSHCRFISNWDREMVAMHQQLQKITVHPILTTYPPPYTPGDDEEASKQTYISRLTFREFSQEGLPMLSSRPFTASAPIPGSYLAGGFIFAGGDFVKTIPNDPQIFFAGEEIAMAVRAFTHGYDIFHPHRLLLWHYYQRKSCPKVWGDHDNQAKEEGLVDKAWWEWDRVAKERVRTLLGLEETDAKTLAPYGLGNIRTLRQFEYRAGICLRQGTVLPEVIDPDYCAYFAAPPDDDAHWLSRQFIYNSKQVSMEKSLCANPHTESLCVSVYTQRNTLMYKKMLDSTELARLCADSDNDEVSLTVKFKTNTMEKPSVVRICPWSDSTGWGAVTEQAW